MAYDKVIDSAALEAALKASADAIRGKTGGSGAIPWDAVKGFADAIAAIEAGGVGLDKIGGLDFAYGTIVNAETPTGKIRINHEEMPVSNTVGSNTPGCFTFVFTNRVLDSISGVARLSWAVSGNLGKFMSTSYAVYVTSSDGRSYHDGSSFTIEPPYSTYFDIQSACAKKMLAGIEYTWVRFGVK